jgi:HK97 family phage prohead protease
MELHSAAFRFSPSLSNAKFTALDLKAVAEDGAFEGYASLFNAEDLGHDVILPGAFQASLNARGPAGVKMLFQHDPKEPIGVWQSLREDARGLYARGRLMPEVARAREVLALMKAGALDGLSIGFKALKGRRDAKTGVRRIAAVDLWEISVVTFPMLSSARVASVKARPFEGRVPTERDFERWLTRDAGLTRSEARAVLRSGFKGLAALRDAGAGTTEAYGLAGKIAAAARLLRANS